MSRHRSPCLNICLVLVHKDELVEQVAADDMAGVSQVLVRPVSVLAHLPGCLSIHINMSSLPHNTGVFTDI